MKREVGVVMDPIGSIKIAKDSTFAMLLAAQRRGWSLWYMEVGDLCLLEGVAQATMRPLMVQDDPAGWFTLGDAERRPLAALDVALMRKDPPFDMEYVYATYLLELAAAGGCLVVNDPRTLRDANEKVFAAHFPDCVPPLTVTRSAVLLREFIAAQGDVVLKPLDAMGGRSIFRVRAGDPNTGVIIRIGNPSHPERPGWPEEGGCRGWDARSTPNCGADGRRGGAGARVPGCWGVHLRGSVPPADERGRTVSCSREATATRRCAGQTRSRGRAGRAGLSPAWPQAHPPGRVGHGRARFATSIMLKVTRAMSAVTCLAAVVVRRDDVCFGSGWISRACGFSPTTTTRWTPWCSMWRR
jgi:hypothetical protein